MKGVKETPALTGRQLSLDLAKAEFCPHNKQLSEQEAELEKWNLSQRSTRLRWCRCPPLWEHNINPSLKDPCRRKKVTRNILLLFDVGIHVFGSSGTSPLLYTWKNIFMFDYTYVSESCWCSSGSRYWLSETDWCLDGFLLQMQTVFEQHIAGGVGRRTWTHSSILHWSTAAFTLGKITGASWSPTLRRGLALELPLTSFMLLR